jgi:4-hydroxybenzoate polyprenyltransferase
MHHNMEHSRAMPLTQLRGLVKTMRPQQWIPKNGIVFAALVLSGTILAFQLEPILRVTAAFVIFALISSCAYILNDLLDIEKDRAHPTKRNRPLPSGQLSIGTARVALGVFLVIALVSAWLLSPLFALIVALYFVNNILYSTILKNMVILDVFSIAAGFVLRALGGTIILSVPISPWLYILTALFSLFLGISKRRHEVHLLKEGSGAFRKVLNQYSVPMLEEMLNVVTSSTVIAYSIYTFTAENLPSNHAMMLTIPFVVYGIFRYLYLVHSGQDAPPDEMLLKDRPLIATVILWGISVILILYGFGMG